ncbi:GTP cyclohydrolase I, putative [Plasmodium ovale]|nr:GTP cyclohydrolase I, putative [Plasmodium ovale]
MSKRVEPNEGELICEGNVDGWDLTITGSKPPLVNENEKGMQKNAAIIEKSQVNINEQMGTTDMKKHLCDGYNAYDVNPLATKEHSNGNDPSRSNNINLSTIPTVEKGKSECNTSNKVKEKKKRKKKPNKTNRYDSSCESRMSKERTGKGVVKKIKKRNLHRDGHDVCNERDVCGGGKLGSSTNAEKQIVGIGKSMKNILNISKLPKRDILKRTHRRFAETFLYLTNGYNMDIEKIIKRSLYKRKYENNSVIKITDIHIYSLCKHHLLPFEGICNIEYKPDKYIMGLSKFSRIIDVFARRLQLQEDLTNDICNALKKYLKPLNLQVTIIAKHLCINMRGVKEHDASTVTHAYYEFKKRKKPLKNGNSSNPYEKEENPVNYDVATRVSASVN